MYAPPTSANHVWAYEFVFDLCAQRSVAEGLTIVDEWTRERLAIDVTGGIRLARVIEVLAQLVSTHGAPRYIRSDKGSEFVSRAILRWLTHEKRIQAGHLFGTSFLGAWGSSPWGTADSTARGQCEHQVKPRRINLRCIHLGGSRVLQTNWIPCRGRVSGSSAYQGHS